MAFNEDDKQLLEQADEFRQAYHAVREQITRMIVGQEEIIDGVLTCLFVGGHALIQTLVHTGSVKAPCRPGGPAFESVRARRRRTAEGTQI